MNTQCCRNVRSWIFIVPYTLFQFHWFASATNAHNSRPHDNSGKHSISIIICDIDQAPVKYLIDQWFSWKDRIKIIIFDYPLSPIFSRNHWFIPILIFRWNILKKPEFEFSSIYSVSSGSVAQASLKIWSDSITDIKAKPFNLESDASPLANLC